MINAEGCSPSGCGMTHIACNSSVTHGESHATNPGAWLKGELCVSVLQLKDAAHVCPTTPMLVDTASAWEAVPPHGPTPPRHRPRRGLVSGRAVPLRCGTCRNRRGPFLLDRLAEALGCHPGGRGRRALPRGVLSKQFSLTVMPKPQQLRSRSKSNNSYVMFN